MIKRFSLKKISRYTVLLLVVFLFYLFPKKEIYQLNIPVSNNVDAYHHDVFLLDKNNYVAKTTIDVSSDETNKLIDELIEIMTIDGKYQDKIPNGFTPLLPVDTKLLNKEIKDDLLILNFNNEILQTKKEQEEKIIEALIYTMTSIDKINQIQIKVEDKELNKLPKSGLSLNNPLKRDYGINKIYDITGIKNINKVIIYYTSKTNDDFTYYIPVTKYINNKTDKIKIIIDELTSKISYETNLMSYLNYNAKLLDYSFNDDEIDLNFNEYLYDNNHDKKVLEEVIYTISYSIKDNYNIDKINFYVNNQQIK